ncbi:MAG TPA: TolC family protein [Bacteroidales bacterium]|jgi:cobalt-zinc-cadmium efflux system outer membrane protein|nr:TolC family protein [Bacteroidales bacterium]HOX73985.1 TolC family protein [Bacteroidales bacterium]HPM87706.1 TolC family protein [Bacteroidales bacterium]HQM69975.1 TolC family protein [Bacteroidales bacterium]
MKKIFKPFILSLVIFASVSHIVSSQKLPAYLNDSISLPEYLSAVRKGNLGYAAGKFDVDMAEAELKASKIFPDPEISVVYSNNEDRILQMGQSLEAGISYPVSLGNKRRAGIAVARSQYELSTLMLNAYFQNLRAGAAIKYFEALRYQKIYLLKTEIYRQLEKLARADSLRLVAGEATPLDAMQSSLEAKSQLAEVYQSNADMQNSYLELINQMGRKYSDTIIVPAGDFPDQNHEYDLNELIAGALENRSELLAAFKNREVSENYMNLIKAERAPEFNIEAGYSYNSIVRNEIAPAPEYNGLSAGISLPLKFSSLNRGNISAADMAVKQSLTLYEEIRLQITSEVIQAYNNFIARKKKAGHYNTGLIDDALKILEGRIYSYQHGESGLIEVLNAQRTYTELRINFLEALFGYTEALISLERSAGIWKISD